MIRAAEQVVPLKLDVDKKEVIPIAQKYKVSLIPAILLLDSSGKVVGKVEYSGSAAKFAADVDKIVKGYKPGPGSAGGSKHR